MLPGADKEEETAKLTLLLNTFDNYADKMKAYRKKYKLTQKELAAIMGVKHLTLRSWEQKQAKPPYHIWRLHKNLFDDTVDLP